jgi:hypothetical protein
MGHHLVDGKFKSDKYPELPADKIVLSFNDKLAQPALQLLSELYKEADPELSLDIAVALINKGHSTSASSVVAVELKIDTHRVNEDIDAGGRRTPAYWRTAAWCKDGSVVIGTGDTPEESKQEALKRREARHTFQVRPPKERLRVILATRPSPDYLLMGEVTEAIRAIAEIILEDKTHG